MLKPTNPYRFQVDDIWNVNISSPKDANIVVQAYVQKSGVGDVYVSKSKPLHVKIGLTSLSKILVQPEYVDFRSAEIRSWVDANNSLPPGHYSICYVVSCADVNCGGSGILGADTKFCSNFVIETPSPLLLSYPSNESVIKDLTPQLTWIPPSPVSQDVRYELKLVKINKDQSRQDAITRNIPLIHRDDINGITLSFPADIDPLVEGESYSWEVYAVLFGERIARSEVWEFTIGKDTQEIKVDPFNYIKIRQVNPTSVVHIENTLRLDYHELVNKSSELQLEILTTDGKRKGSVSLPIQYGENLLDVSLSNMGLKPNTEYVVRIANAKGENFEIRIHYSFSY